MTQGDDKHPRVTERDGLQTSGRLKPPVKARPLAAHVDELAGIAGAAGTLIKRWHLEEAERAWATENTADPRRPGVYAPGDRVVYTARFLQLAFASRAAWCGPEAVAHEWTVQECGCELCALGQHLCTTEWLEAEGAFRHLARVNVRHAGLVQSDEVQMLELGKQPKLTRAERARLARIGRR